MRDDELDEALAGLPYPSPAPDFADRVMARVALQQPLAATRPSLAAAASLAVVIFGSMLASIVWTLSHQAALAASGRRAVVQMSVWAWTGLHLLAHSSVAREIVAHPVYMAAGLALGSLVYAGGLFSLFRLIAGPTSSRVAYVGR